MQVELDSGLMLTDRVRNRVKTCKDAAVCRYICIVSTNHSIFMNVKSVCVNFAIALDKIPEQKSC